MNNHTFSENNKNNERRKAYGITQIGYQFLSCEISFTNLFTDKGVMCWKIM